MTTVSVDDKVSKQIDPLNPDTDGDGYWDGWIGVYGVGRTDTVVLYMDNLQSGDGVEGDEIVSEQMGVHPVNGSELTHSHMSVKLYEGSDTRYHSNIHLGELHWAYHDPSEFGHPTKESITPSPELDIEVDYLYNTPEEEWRPALSTSEQSFELLGIDVDYIVDEELSESQLSDGCYYCPTNFEWDDELPPISRDDADEIEEEFHDIDDSVYLLMIPSGGQSAPILAPNLDRPGVASSDGSGGFGNDFGIVINTGSESIPDIEQNIMQKIVHETGHVLGAGRADDPAIPSIMTETYSGGDNDDTKEYAPFPSKDENVDHWSAMTLDTYAVKTDPPMEGDYVAFSIEEVSTIETNNVVAETHNLIAVLPDIHEF